MKKNYFYVFSLRNLYGSGNPCFCKYGRKKRAGYDNS